MAGRAAYSTQPLDAIRAAQKKLLCVHNFDILEVKYRVLLEMVSFFPPHTTLGVGKKTWMGSKIWGTLGDVHTYCI